MALTKNVGGKKRAFYGAVPPPHRSKFK